MSCQFKSRICLPIPIFRIIRSMIEVQAYINEGSGFSISDEVYAGLEALWIEDFADDQVKNPKFAREALVDLTRVDSGIHVVFIAVDADEGVVGTCFANYEANSWLLDGAFVTADRRGERIFSAIMEKVKKIASLQGITDCIAQPSKRAPDYWRPALGRWGFFVSEDYPDTLIYRKAAEYR